MYVVEFIKRIAPFALALALGLFVASFFISISAPNFKRGRFSKHREYHRQQESEVRQLRDDNCRLKRELENEKRRNQSETSHDWENSESQYPLIRKNDNFQPRIENQDIQHGKKK